MPKVTRDATSQPLRELSAMAIDDEQLPLKPNFSALSAHEQQKGKVEFRRVSGGGSGWVQDAVNLISRHPCRLLLDTRDLSVMVAHSRLAHGVLPDQQSSSPSATSIHCCSFAVLIYLQSHRAAMTFYLLNRALLIDLHAPPSCPSI